MNSRFLTVVALLASVAFVRPEAAPPEARPTSGPAAASETTRQGIADAMARVRFEPNRGQFADAAEYIGRGAGSTMFFGKTDAEIRVGSHTVRLQWADAGPHAQVVAEQQLPGIVSYVRGSDPAAWFTDLPTFAQLRQRNVYAGIDIVYYSHADGLEFDLAVAPQADLSRAELTIAGARAVRVTEAGELLLTLDDATLTIRQPVAFQDGVRVPVRYVQRGPAAVGFEASYDSARPLVVDPVIAYSTLRGAVNEDRVYTVTTDSAGNVIAGIQTNPYAAASMAPFDSYALKLDPQLSTVLYTVFYGGGVPATCRDRIGRARVDAADNVYFTGGTNCTDFPTTPGAYVAAGSLNDVYILKLNPAGGVVYSSRFGGVGNDVGLAVAVDAAGNVYAAGSTNSANYPVTPGAYQTVLVGANTDAFVTKLNAAGSATVYSTYLGGAGIDNANALDVDLAGSAYVAMRADSAGLATTPGAHQAAIAGGTDVYIAALNAAGSALGYATYLGGAGTDTVLGIRVDEFGQVYLTGATTSVGFPTTVGAFQTVYGGGTEDGFFSKLTPLGGLAYSTFLGGSLADRGNALVRDSAGNTYVTGATGSANFPVVNPFQPVAAGAGDAFLTKFSPAPGVLWSSYLGGSLGLEEGTALAANGTGRVIVGGSTAICNTCVVNNYPTTPGAHQTASGGGIDGASLMRWDGFVTVLLSRSLVLTPASQTLLALGPHSVTATLTEDGAPVAGTSIKFTVSGGTTLNGECVTDGAGQCVISYTGSLLSGVDTINAYGDGDGDTFADFDEPVAQATITRNYPGGAYGLLEGVVLNQDNFAPIENATVVIHDLGGTPFASAVTAENGFWQVYVPYGTYKARTSGVTGYVNELHGNLACEPICGLGPGTPIVLNAPYNIDGVFFFLQPLATARLNLSGAGTHAPGGNSSPFTVNVSGPHALGGTLTYSRNGNNLVATNILGWSTTGSVTTIIGAGTLNGVPGASFHAVFDNGPTQQLRMRILQPITGVVLVSTQVTPLTSGAFTIVPVGP